MKKTIKILAILPVLLGLLLAGCTVEAPDADQTLRAPQGEEVFANYVALGNSLTAGYMDSGLSRLGQASSYPSLIARQIGAAEFTQPWVELPGVGGMTQLGIAGVLHFTGTGIEVLDYTTPSAGADPTGGLLLALAQPTPYHNLGVPGAFLHDVLNTTTSEHSVMPNNSFFDFINRASFFDNVEKPLSATTTYQSASMFGAALAKGPTLATLWIGNNDILGSATSGTDQAMTDPAVFQAEYTTLLGGLAGGLIQRTGWPATIIVATVPSVTSTPFFMAPAQFEAVFQSVAGVPWSWGYDEADVALVTFSALSGATPGVALAGNYTLTNAEVLAIETRTAQFNGVINAVAAAFSTPGSELYGMAKVGVVDSQAELGSWTAEQRTHFLFMALAGDTAAASKTYFSLDGVHPNNMGYGRIANVFIDKINEVAGTDVPPVDPGALSWDPTYSAYQPISNSKTGGPLLTRDAAEAMTAIWR